MGGKTLLVTGASGFTGGHLIEAAKKQGHQCIALCHHATEVVPQADTCITANLNDLASLKRAVSDIEPDYVVHLAAISFVAHENVGEIYQTNLIGTLNLLAALEQSNAKPEKILLASSANIYGNTGQLPITEDTPVQPANHYGISKYAMEQAAALFGDLPIVVVRPFNYTGVGQSSNFLIPKIVGAFSKGEKVLELGNLDVARDFSDVRDVVHAYLKLLEAPKSHPVYNICTGQVISLEYIIALLNDLAGYEIKVSTNPAFVRADEIKTLYGSPKRLEYTIGSFRHFTFGDTLKWMLQRKETY